MRKFICVALAIMFLMGPVCIESKAESLIQRWRAARVARMTSNYNSYNQRYATYSNRAASYGSSGRYSTSYASSGGTGSTYYGSYGSNGGTGVYEVQSSPVVYEAQSPVYQMQSPVLQQRRTPVRNAIKGCANGLCPLSVNESKTSPECNCVDCKCENCNCGAVIVTGIKAPGITETAIAGTKAPKIGDSQAYAMR